MIGFELSVGLLEFPVLVHGPEVLVNWVRKDYKHRNVDPVAFVESKET